MSSIAIAVQVKHQCIHVVSDRASYDERGTIGGFLSKVYALPNWPGAIVSRGSGYAGSLLAYAIALNFPTFDGMVDGIDSRLSEILVEFGIRSSVEINLVGFSAKRGGPESYLILTDDELPIGATQEDLSNSALYASVGKLQQLPDVTVGPAPPPEMILSAWFERLNVDDDPKTVIRALRKVGEMQRHALLDPDGIYWVGGGLDLTTVRPDGIRQRALHVWPEDKVGELIRPTPIDWSEWNVRHGFKAGPNKKAR